LIFKYTFYLKIYKITFQLRESAEHDYCKKLVATILTNADRVCNRECAWIEYPIFTHYLLDEYFFNKMYDICELRVNLTKKYTQKDCIQQLDDSEFVPTYDFCKRNGYNPVAVLDVACAWKGSIKEIWEITKSNSLTKEKVEKIVHVLGDDILIYEINVKDIMKLNIHDPNLYDKLVIKAKKWDLKYMQIETYDIWLKNQFIIKPKYDIDINACKKTLWESYSIRTDNNNYLKDMFRYKMKLKWDKYSHAKRKLKSFLKKHIEINILKK
jgi:hypothetical protein